MIIYIRFGEKNRENTKFNINCESFLSLHQNRFAKESDVCFGRGDKDHLGWISFGFFILIIGIVFALNPQFFSDFGIWIQNMVEEGMPMRPQKSLIISAILFFSMMGISNFVIAIIRVIIYKVNKKMLSDVLSGIALTSFAYLIYLYNNYYLTWKMVLGIEIIAIGLLIILYSVIQKIFFLDGFRYFK